MIAVDVFDRMDGAVNVARVLSSIVGRRNVFVVTAASGTLESKGPSTSLATHDKGVSLETSTCSEQDSFDLSCLVHGPVVACHRDPTRAIVVFHVDKKSSECPFGVLHTMFDDHIDVAKRILLLLRIAMQKARVVSESLLRSLEPHSRYRRAHDRVADLVFRRV